MTRFLVVLFLLATPGIGWAQEADSTVTASQLSPDDQSRVAMRLMSSFLSPYCPGASIRDCGSGEAEAVRVQIREWVAEGRSEQWITDQMVAEFGESILGKPLFQGWGAVTYIAPIGALLLGLVAVLVFLKRQQSAIPRQPVGAIETPENYHLSSDANDRVERELQARSQT